MNRECRDGRVRVLIVDDTRTIRSLIRAHLAGAPEIEVVGEAGDPYEARELIRSLDPDVITLDVEMPRMDGLSFLEKIMRLRPMPVVMVSTRTTEKSHAAVRALSLGAVDCVDIALLTRGGRGSVDLAETVLMPAASRPRLLQRRETCQRQATDAYQWNGKIVVIGSSTGGVDALMTVLADFPVDCPPTVIAQHMPASFLQSFTARLDRHIAPRVVLAEDGMRLEKGLVCLAPGGDAHVALAPRDPQRLQIVPDDGNAAYVPSVDILFSSAAPHARTTIGVILTGMGRDGADAMAMMRAGGAYTIAQDAETSVVDGMPKAAREVGAAVEVAALQDVGARILASASRTQKVTT